MPTVTVEYSGPIFHARAATDRLIDEITETVAQAAHNDVHRNMATSFRNPTGYYQSRVITQNAGRDMVVTDQGVVYGPWLEGVGSRNATTRFKGYFSFRRAVQTVTQRIDSITSPVVADFVRRVD